MKRWWPESAIVLSVCIAAFLFNQQYHRESTDQGMILKGLKGARHYLPVTSTIGVWDGLHRAETEVFARYALAPVQVIPVWKGAFDTVIMLLPKQAADTADIRFIKNRTIIWSHQDDRFRYYLVRKS